MLGQFGAMSVLSHVGFARTLGCWGGGWLEDGTSGIEDGVAF